MTKPILMLVTQYKQQKTEENIFFLFHHCITMKTWKSKLTFKAQGNIQKLIFDVHATVTTLRKGKLSRAVRNRDVSVHSKVNDGTTI